MAADPKLSLKPVDEPDTLLTALLAVQRELPRLSLKKTGKNPAFRSSYLTLDGLHDAILPLLNDCGLVWITQPGRAEDGSPILWYALINARARDEQLTGAMPLMLDKQNSQGLGSAITYARRYSLCSVIGAVGDPDDDGNAASTSEVTKEVRKKKEPRRLTIGERAQIKESVEKVGKTIEMAAKAVGKDDPADLTEEDGWAILEKIKASTK